MNGRKRDARDDWGHVFRGVVSSARTGAFLVLLVAFVGVSRTDGLAQVFNVVVGLVALVAAFPQSPLIPAIIQWIPGLPTKGQA